MNVTLSVAFDVPNSPEVSVTKDELRGIAHEFFERLERRVGARLAAMLDDAVAADWTASTGPASSEFIDRELPDYAEVVRTEFEAVFASLGEIIAEFSETTAPKIVVTP